MKKKNTTLNIIAVITVLAVAALIIGGSGPNRGTDATHNTRIINNSTVSNQVAGVTAPNPDVRAELAPDFTLETLDGDTVTLSSFIGEKPVILDFWTSWCHNCQRAMPKTSKLYDEFNGQVEVLGVNLRENNNAITRFVDSHNIGFPILLDPSGLAARLYGVRYTNTHVLVHKDGTLAGVIPGDIGREHFEVLLES